MNRECCSECRAPGAWQGGVCLACTEDAREREDPAEAPRPGRSQEGLAFARDQAAALVSHVSVTLARRILEEVVTHLDKDPPRPDQDAEIEAEYASKGDAWRSGYSAALFDLREVLRPR